MPTFVRVAHRQGWQVELVRAGAPVETETLPTREEAMARAEAMAPEWIEVGDIVGLDTPGQRHSWSTLRRQPDGSYAPTKLRWGGV
ncbi:MAG: hypothetical protein ACREPA_04300 [Candidatus Dormibacteraceae bacterium]